MNRIKDLAALAGFACLFFGVATILFSIEVALWVDKMGPYNKEALWWTWQGWLFMVIGLLLRGWGKWFR